MGSGEYHGYEATCHHEQTSHFLVAIYRMVMEPESTQRRQDVLEHVRHVGDMRLNVHSNREVTLEAELDALLAGDESVWAPFLIPANGHYLGSAFFGSRFGREPYLTKDEQKVFDHGARLALQSISPFKDYLVMEVQAHRDGWGRQDDMRQYYRTVIEGRGWSVEDGDIYYVAIPTCPGDEVKVGWLRNISEYKKDGPTLLQGQEVEA